MVGHFSDHAYHCTEGEPLPGVALGVNEYLQRHGHSERLGVLNLIRQGGTLRFMLPWLWDDLEQLDQYFGGDGWPDGL